MRKTTKEKLIKEIKNEFVLLDEPSDFEINLFNRAKKEAFLIKQYRGISNFKEIIKEIILYKSINKYKLLLKYEVLYGKEEALKKYNELQKTRCVTLENMIRKYGNEEGEEKFKKYCERQSYTNTFEYKNKKYGMTEEEFIRFNKSRAVTFKNRIEKYGEVEGIRKWKEYCERQSYTNTEAYLGSERYKEVNKRKSHTLKNYILRYKNEDLAINKLKEHSKNKKLYSKTSQKFFWKIYDLFTEEEKEHMYFGEKNQEYYINANSRLYYYDFVCTSLKLCIEYHGDHYHGNPVIYRPNDVLKGRGMSHLTAEEAWSNDLIKKNVLLESRDIIEYIEVWESDVLNEEQKIIQKIGDVIERCRENIKF